MSLLYNEFENYTIKIIATISQEPMGSVLNWYFFELDMLKTASASSKLKQPCLLRTQKDIVLLFVPVAMHLFRV